jgi:hypothetical protein
MCRGALWRGERLMREGKAPPVAPASARDLQARRSPNGPLLDDPVTGFAAYAADLQQTRAPENRTETRRAALGTGRLGRAPRCFEIFFGAMFSNYLNSCRFPPENSGE